MENIKTYKEIEEEVFKWMIYKNNIDSSFTFSTRQNASKGSEGDYFIGTEKSKYIGITFWAIPIKYNGSNLINLWIIISNKGYSYRFEFHQTLSPVTVQDKLALKFIVDLKPIIKKILDNFSENQEDNYEKYRFDSKNYDSIYDLLNDTDKDLSRILPIIDNEIAKFKKVNKEFNAHRITKEEFELFIEKLKRRRAKYGYNYMNDVQASINPLKSNSSLNQILYGPPGTGKTYSTIIEALKIVAPEIYKKHKGSYSKLKEEFNKQLITDYSKVKQDGQIAFCTFHQSMSYEDFIEGIKPELENKTKLEYAITEGIFKKMSAWAESALESKKKYVLIIDEINRGNISQIFGELITLIEDDKRIGQAHSLTAFLPYSKKPFGVPDNLHIIGTMNTADRSVEALDTALRRRFYFKEMPPMYEGFENIKEFKDPVTKIDLKLLLKAINSRLEVLLSRDHLIGHSYFLNVAIGKSSLAHVFEHNIIPLLQEYFYGDFEKIAMVIGKSFVEGIKGKAKANQFMIESDSESDYFDKDIWAFNKDLFNPNNKNSFAKAVQLIYS